MTGAVSVIIKDNRNTYTFTLKRNITILCGESGRGKTTLFDMVRDYNRYGKASGTKIRCDKNILAVSGNEWQTRIESAEDTVIIIDEDNAFIRSQDFAAAAKKSSCYFVLITRAYLPQLPVSVTEIYELTGNKNKRFKPLYTNDRLMYNQPHMGKLPFKPEIIITEDSGTGYQFFQAAAGNTNISCLSAHGKSNIYQCITENIDRKILVIADGAAFGAEIRSIVEKQKLFPEKLGIFLPESFEWLILKSGIVSNPEWEQVTMPEKFIDSRNYYSWEQYFTDLLISATHDIDFLRYDKGKLPDFYIQPNNINKVKNLASGIDFEEHTS